MNNKDLNEEKIDIKGIFFKKAFANSESIETRFDGNIKILFKKIGVPKPINKSLEKYPQKILPKPRINNGVAIRIGAS